MLLQFIFKRILSAVPIMLAVSTIVFFLIHMIPGDPVDLILGEHALTADRAALARDLHLDEPVMAQYFKFMGGLATGRWGVSIFDRRPVLELISERFGATCMLAFSAMFVAALVAIPAGVLAAVRRRTFLDNFLMCLALIGISVPNFWLGPVLILVFSVHMGLLPISGRDSYVSLLLPAITLGSALSAMLSRLTRAAMIEEMGRDYVTTARAKGLSERKVIFKHALRNALNPVITIIGLQVGSLLAGTVITEKIFGWPGVGMLLLDSINRRDYPVVQGSIIVISFMFVAVNTLTDCLYRIADPRVKL